MYTLYYTPGTAGVVVHLTLLMRWSRNLPRSVSEWTALNRLTDLIRTRASAQKVYAVEEFSGW